MRRMARVGDSWSGVCFNPEHAPNIPFPVGGSIITGDGMSIADGRPIARIGDTVKSTCGHTGTIVTGSGCSVFQNDRPGARVGDSTSGDLVGQITTGSPNSMTC